MKILIIGGTRFIGPHVLKGLQNHGHDVAVFHRGSQSDSLSNVTHFHGDRSQLRDYTLQFKNYNPDVVLDMIPLSKQHARDVLETFHAITHRIVAISSCDVYQAFGRIIGTESSPTVKSPITETSPLRENHFIFKSVPGRESYEKILVEEELINSNYTDATLLRLPMVYGPNDYQHRMFPYLKRMIDERPYVLLDEDFANWKWTKGYVENVAHAIIVAVENKALPHPIYNVGEARTKTMKEWIQDIGRVYGWQGEVISVPKDQLPSHLQETIDASQPLDVDSSRIRKDLNYRDAVSYFDGIKKTVDWQKNHYPEFKNEEFNYKEEDQLLQKLGYIAD